MILPDFIERPEAYLPEDLKPGEGIPYTDNSDTHVPKRIVKIILACPNCGRVAAKPNAYDGITKTATPSIVCGDGNLGCGWHGFLKNGIFTV